MRLRHSLVGAIAGGDRPSVLFRYMPQGTLSSNPGFGGTFTRADASTCATYVDSNGVVQTVAANVLRDSHYVNGVRTTLLEGSRINSCLQSSNYGVTWAATTCTVTGSATTGPDGVAASASLLTQTGSGGRVNQDIVFAAGGSATFSVFVKKSAAFDTTSIILRDNTGAVNFGTTYTFSSNTFGGTDANTTARSTTGYTNGFVRISVTNTAAIAAGNTIRLYIYGGNSGNAADSVYVYGAQLELGAAFPSSYIATAASAVTRAADALSFPFLPVPQAMTVYADLYNLGTWQGSLGIFDLGTYSAPTGTTFGGYANPTVGRLNVVATSELESQPSITAAYGDRCELRGALSANGSILGGASLNSGAETLGSQSAANALGATFRVATLTVNNLNTVGTGFAAFRSLKIASGVQSLATMRGL